MSTQPFSSVPVVSRASWPPRAPSRLQAYAALCAVSFVCYIAGRLTDGGAGTLFSFVGAGACGWAWLLTRALFDPAPRDVWWPRIVATVVAVTGALTILAPAEGGLSGFAANVYRLSGSTAMLLAFIEPFQARRVDVGVLEKRFRLAFLTINAAQLVAVLGSGITSPGTVGVSRTDLIRIACCVVGLIGASAAIWYRLRHPLVQSDGTGAARRAPTDEDRRLAERLLALLRDDAIDSRPDLRIGDVAARLGQPEYKVSQCISTVLGFPNFNRLINHHRIERAKRLLADPDQVLPILEVPAHSGGRVRVRLRICRTVQPGLSRAGRRDAAGVPGGEPAGRLTEPRRLPLETWGRHWLGRLQTWADRAAWSRYGFEFLMFGIKQAWACLFGGAMLALLMGTHLWWPEGAPVSRYDFLVIGAVAIQAAMLALKLESWEEARVIFVFHVVGTVMELFKTQAGSWIYPEDSLLRIGMVPLFSGFMYAAVGSYIARIWRIFDIKFRHYPPLWTTWVLAAAIYVNFFAHHWLPDVRLGLFALTAVLFGRGWFYFTPDRRRRTMPFLPGFFLVAVFIWLAENVGTYARAWAYPGQEDGWEMVSLAKLGSWFLLMMISVVLVSLVHRPEEEVASG